MTPRLDLSRPTLVQAGIVLATFVVGGVVAGFAVTALWTPPKGMVLEGTWYRGLISLSPPTIAQNVDQGVFAATGWFSVCAIVLGLLVGAGAALWATRSELLTLGAAIIGGTVAGLIMLQITALTSPDDPRPLAKGLADGAVLPDRFDLASPWLVLLVPGSAMLALMVVFLMWAPHQLDEHADGMNR